MTVQFFLRATASQHDVDAVNPECAVTEVCPEGELTYSPEIGFKVPIFKKWRGFLPIERFTRFPSDLEPFLKTVFYETCPVTVLTAEALSEIPVSSRYTIPLPFNRLTPDTTDFVQLCQNLIPDLGSNQAPYIFGGEVDWAYPGWIPTKLDLTCIATRPCAETSEFLFSAAKCACSSLQLPVCLMNGAILFKF